ncbi:hypothetical protein D3C72_2072630 [compost metagenome]
MHVHLRFGKFLVQGDFIRAIAAHVEKRDLPRIHGRQFLAGDAPPVAVIFQLVAQERRVEHAQGSRPRHNARHMASGAGPSRGWLSTYCALACACHGKWPSRDGQTIWYKIKSSPW